MEVINLDHTCYLLNLPICRLVKPTNTPFTSRGISILNLYIPSLANLCLILIISICVIRLIINTKKMYSGIGRNELSFFFYLYLSLNIIELLLLSDVLLNIQPKLFKMLVPFELSIMNTCFFSLLLGNFLSTTFMRMKFLSPLNILRFLSAAYSTGFVVLFFYLVKLKNCVLIFAFTFGVNVFIAFLYYLKQLVSIKSLNLEIWVFWTLNIALAFFMLTGLPLFIGGEILAWLTNGYLDGLFFFHLFGFCTVVMIHKYWLSICSDEAECTFLIMN
ncbi:Chitin synthase export chaperone [Dictyocoela muelleri]|nr:Chitin synthase export chaperone [Dictyocoela muelleri]